MSGANTSQISSGKDSSLRRHKKKIKKLKRDNSQSRNHPGQRELLRDRSVLVLWIWDRKCGYSVEEKRAVVANVRIVGDNISNDAGDLFLLGNSLGVPHQSRVIGFAP